VGNICNASPAADSAPNLLALDAGVALASARGERVSLLADFITGNRETTREPDEMVVAMTIAKPAPGTESLFLKLGARSYMVISIVMVALVIEPDGDRVGSARIAVGACAAVSKRLAALEQSLVGLKLDSGLGNHVETLPGLDPIDDIRGSAAYRADAAVTLVRRGLAELGGRMGAGP
ncbi:MAG: FAD binding domain-containing protein, partial [Proteobacteria bacterium]|nr:FAD binding domain-containing protein [Pseudomonadota bacterium]